MRLLTKWATADVPVRIPSRVVAVPVERTRVRPVVHVTTRDDHRSRVPNPLCSLRVTFICDRHLCRLQNFAEERASGMYVLRFLYRKLRGRKVPRSPLKWSLSSLRATADVPVRIPSRVVAVPVERTRVRPVGHVTTREDHFSAFGGIIVIAEVGVA